MGKEVRGIPEDSPLRAGGAGADRIGAYLALQRRLRGISLAELSERTKIPQRSLERLESGVFDSAPDGFARGFVRTVAAALGLDADEAVMRLLEEPPEEDAGVSRSGTALSWAVALLALAALVAVALFALWSLGSAFVSGRDDAGVTLQYRQDAVRDLVDAPAPFHGDAGSAPPAAPEESAPVRPLESPGVVHPDRGPDPPHGGLR
jgi:transcriptional regulator with XRE-family HTH domain